MNAKHPSAYSMGRAIELQMHTRRIDGAWYIIMDSDDGWTDPCNAHIMAGVSKAWTEGETLMTQFCDSEGDETHIPMERMGNTPPAFERTYDGLRLSVYKAADTNVAVFYKADGDKDILRNERLNIGGCETDILMDGYLYGATGIFCCVLTDAELRAIENGAVPALIPPPLEEGADFGHLTPLWKPENIWMV